MAQHPGDRNDRDGAVRPLADRLGFDYFYGFLAGETSQYEPRLFQNTTAIEPPHDPTYHLTEDMADKALSGCAAIRHSRRTSRSSCIGRRVARTARIRSSRNGRTSTKGKFDDGWDAYRERVFERQKQLGWIPADTKLTPRSELMASWASIPEDEKPFQRRLMEVFAGFVEHTDAQVGRLVSGIEQLGLRDNTIIFYIFGDNGSSAEGQNGTISELLAQNQIPNTIQQQLAALDKIGGLDTLGSNKVENMYHAGWAWAGDTPFRYTKLVASHFGGTRNPMVISWPKGIKPDATPRPQFHHVNDIVPTIYDVLGITPPKVVNGIAQDPIDGVSMVYTFADAKAPWRKTTQYFENNGSRGIYHDGWYAPRVRSADAVADRQPRARHLGSQQGRLGTVRPRHDFSQADNVAAEDPNRLAAMKQLFLEQAQANKVFPIGAGLWTRLHPEDRVKVPYTHWTFDASTTRLPEFAAPGLGRESNRVVVDASFGPDASGVLYALGGIGGGLTLYMDKGHLVYEYNMMMIERYIERSAVALPPGRHQIAIDTAIPKPAGPGVVTISVDGKDTMRIDVKRTVAGAFSASETLDVGMDLGSPVSFDYFDRAPFRFDGRIEKVEVQLQ